MTIYIGGRERTATLAHILNEQFGKKLEPAKAWTNIRLVGEISARFDAQDFPGGAYAVYGEARGLYGLKEFGYTMWNHAENMPAEHRLAIGRRTMNEITKDFGDYCLGTGSTQRYQQTGIAGLPIWAQHWCIEGQVPFELETAAIRTATPVSSGMKNKNPLNFAHSQTPEAPLFSITSPPPKFTRT